MLISGPTSITIAKYGDLEFILFGDQHFSVEGMCKDIQCANANTLTDQDFCYTVDGIIAKIIDDANQQQKYVDIYLEAAPPGPIVEKIQAAKLEYPLSNTKTRFHSCLYDFKSCPYKNARFHYVDIRSSREIEYTWEISILSSIDSFSKNFITQQTKNKIINRTESLRTHLMFLHQEIIMAIFLNTHIFTDSYMYKYYRLCIESDNFIIDVEDYITKSLLIDNEYIEFMTELLIKRYLGVAKYSGEKIKQRIKKILDELPGDLYLMLIHPSIIVNRYGKIMHKVRSQLLALELQGDKERAESIRTSIYEEMMPVNLRSVIMCFNYFNQSRIQYLLTSDPTKFYHCPFPINQFIGDLNGPDSLMMDMYTLARMFRTYPIEFQTKGKSINPHIFPYYIIEYAGEAHIRTVRNYLIKQGAIIDTYPNISKRCISVPLNSFN
jgi:hypothetical protein